VLADSADFALTAIYFSLLAKEKYTKERPPRIFLDPALLIHKDVEVTRYAQTDFNLISLVHLRYSAKMMGKYSGSYSA